MPETSTAPILLEVKDLVKHYPILGGIFLKQVAAVKAVDGIWKVTGLELLEERRVDPAAAGGT